jgi:hypothetical protein
VADIAQLGIQQEVEMTRRAYLLLSAILTRNAPAAMKAKSKLSLTALTKIKTSKQVSGIKKKKKPYKSIFANTCAETILGGCTSRRTFHFNVQEQSGLALQTRGRSAFGSI